jgi:tetratricopeptide (TPR) repeat protein
MAFREFQKPWTSLYYYGWILLNTGDAEGARAAFTTFLEFDPKQGDAYFGLGLLDMERLDLDAAEANFRKAMAQAEAELRAGKRSSGADLAKSTARLGEVMFERERYEAARDFLREALALAPPIRTRPGTSCIASTRSSETPREPRRRWHATKPRSRRTRRRTREA